MSAGGLVKSLAGVLRPREILVRGSRTHASCIAITFDDGPHPQNTPRILEALARRGTVATFFVQGSEAEKYPELVRAMHEAGHQVANHGYQHLSAREHDALTVARNAERCQVILEQQLGATLRRDFRPPHGDINLGSYLALRKRRYRLVFWSFDSLDWRAGSTESVLQRMGGQAFPAGSIVLLHDDYAHTAAALPGVLDKLQEKGHRFVRVMDF